MLLDMYDIDVCKKIRETSVAPVIMLTAVQGEMGSVLNVLLLIIHHPRLEEVFINV